MELESKSYSTLRNKKNLRWASADQTLSCVNSHLCLEAERQWDKSPSSCKTSENLYTESDTALMRLSLSFSDVRTLTGARLSIQKGFSSQADRRCQGSVAVSVTVSVRMDLD